MKAFLSIGMLFIFLGISAKENIYNTNFGTGTVNADPLIAGPPTLNRSGNNSGNIQLSTSSASTGSFFGGLIAASGSGNLVDGSASNPNYTGIASFSSISTVGYHRLELIYIARKTSGYTGTVNLEWSSDGVNWNAVSYTDVSNSGNWEAVNGGIPVLLPSGAEGQSNLRIRFRFERINGSGNYRIDDFTLRGESLKKTIHFDDAAKWTAGSAALGAYAVDHVYNDENFSFSGGPALRQGTTMQDGFAGALGTYSFRLQDAPCTWTATYNSCGTITQFGFSVRRWAFNANTNWSIEYSTDGGSSWTSTGVNITNTFLSNSSNWTVFSHTLVSPATVGSGDFIVSVSRVNGERIMIDDFTYTVSACSNTSYFYRTVASGNWNDACIWETSSNGTSGWATANCSPDFSANTIAIKSGHTVSLSNNIILDQLLVETGAQVNWIGGTFSLLNGTGTDMDVFGVFNNNVSGNQVSAASGATIRIRSGGILRVLTSVANISQNYAAGASSGIFVWDSAAIFDWNNTSGFSASGQTYFPDAIASIIPIFRISSNIATNLGGGSDFGVNGIFEVNGNITFEGNGNLNIRNGFIGTGNFTKTTGTGNIFLTGADTVLFGGSGTLTLGGTLRMATSGTVVVKLINNKVINGGQIRITNPSTLLAQQFELSGTGNAQMNSSSTLITAHANGINGTLGGLSGGISWETTRMQTVVFNRNGAQNSGTFPASLGKVRVLNGSVLNLETNVLISELTNGSFEVSGNGSVLRANTFGTKLSISGNRTLLLENGGKMHNNCLANLDIEFVGNSSIGVLNGNSDTIKCYDFSSIKNTSGGLTFTANTPFRAGNDFRIDFSGGTAVLIDNSNTLAYGDDLSLIGNASNFNLNGTFKLLANSGSNDFETIHAELNHLEIETSGNARPRFRDNVAFSQNIIIKGNFSYSTTSSNELYLNDVNLTVRGNFTNSAPSNRFLKGTSTIVLNGTTNQTLTGLNDFYNLTVNKTSGSAFFANNGLVSNQLNMIAGQISSGTNIIELGTSISNKGVLNYTAGNIDGVLKRWFNGTNSGASTGLFPMGTDTEMKHAMVEFTSAPSAGGSLTVNILESSMGTAGLPVTVPATGTCPAFDITSASNQAYWKIDDADGLTGGVYTITLEAEGFNIITDICELAILKRVGTGNWFLAGSHIEPSGTTGKPTLVVTGATGWSNFGFGGGDLNLLQVEFGELKAEVMNANTVKLNWSKFSEIDNAYFEIQRSDNVSGFKTIASLKGKGNSNNINQYEYIDQSLNQNVYVYRIKQVDLNGKISLSSSVSVSIPEIDNDRKVISTYPNPIINALNLKGLKPGRHQIEFLDYQGLHVFSIEIEQSNEVSSIDLSHLASGVYFLRISNQSNISVLKILKD